VAKQLQLRKGTAAEHSTFTGADGEVTVDTTNKTLRVHDGTTVGGTQLATFTGGSVPAAQLPSATTSTQGIVKLNNSLTSTSTTEALTAAQGKVLRNRDFGIDQFWEDVTISRAMDTIYFNTTTRPIFVVIAGNPSNLPEMLILTIGSTIVWRQNIDGEGANHYQTYNVSFIVPPGATYRIVGLNRVLFHWAELR